MAREPVRGASRSVANLEFHRAGDQVNEISAAIVGKLETRGVRAVNPSPKGIRLRGTSWPARPKSVVTLKSTRERACERWVSVIKLEGIIAHSRSPRASFLVLPSTRGR
jgi:hypothetical protein